MFSNVESLKILGECAEREINFKGLLTIPDSLRKNIRLLKFENLKSLSVNSIQRILRNEKLINCINDSDLDLDDVNLITKSLLDEDEVIYVIKDKNTKKVFKCFKKILEIYDCSSLLNEKFPQILFKYSNKELKLTDVEKIIKFLKRNRYFSYDYYKIAEVFTLGFFKEYSISENTIDIIHNQLGYEYFSLLDSFLKNMNYSLFYSKSNKPIYDVILETLVFYKKENKEKQVIDLLINISKYKKGSKWIKYLITHSMDRLYLNDLIKISYADFSTIGTISPIEYLYANIPCIQKLYSRLEDVYDCGNLMFKIDFLKDLTKKKAFMKLIDENIDLYIDSSKESLLFKSIFTKIVNVNTLNKKNLESVLSNTFSCKESIDILSNIESLSLTYNELDLIIKKKDFINKIFLSLMDLSIDNRIKICKEIPNLKISDLLQNLYINLDENELIEKISSMLRKQTYKELVKPIESKLTYLTDTQKILYLLNREKINKYLDECVRGKDIEFILENYNTLSSFETLLDAKYSLYFVTPEFMKMVKYLNISNDFINSNKKTIIEFCDKGLIDVFLGVMKNTRLNKKQRENMIILTKAELANKLREVKFRDKDFDLEIGFNVPNKTKQVWKVDTLSKDKSYVYEETSDFDKVIRIGQYPVETCQHWLYGSYSQCLLSNFDTNKKLLVATNSNGKTVARSIIRLTKQSEFNIQKEIKNSLEFKDIEDINVNDNKNDITNKEEIILFVEKMYTYLNSNQSKQVRKEFLKLAAAKAKELNAKLVVSNDYKDILIDNDMYELTNRYVFISYSKNGSQYLDSLTGSAYEEEEGTYTSTSVFIKK